MAVTLESVEPPVTTGPPRRPRRRLRRDAGVTVALLLSVVLVLIGGVYPVGAVLTTALSPEAFARYGEFFTSAVDLRMLRNTVVLGVCVGLIGTAIGFL